MIPWQIPPSVKKLTNLLSSSPGFVGSLTIAQEVCVACMLDKFFFVGNEVFGAPE